MYRDCCMEDSENFPITSDSKMYRVLAFYAFVEVESPKEIVRRFLAFFKQKDVKSRIYISEEGINGQMSIHKDALGLFTQWIKSIPCFSKIDIKAHDYHTHAFAKCSVKYRDQLVALDRKVNLSQMGEHLSPAKWQKMLEEKDESTILIDVRNSYESKVGHFKGALQPDLETFREFPSYIQELKAKLDPKKTKVMMYCTGGIRCELYSSLMKEEGFNEVYQLDGGVIKYGLEQGNKHWEGNLFVFDDRLVVPISSEENEIISSCHFCDQKTDVYYNCANMDCNDLFVACKSCIEREEGCCSKACFEKGRRREFDSSKMPTPYRKLSQEEKKALTKT